MPVALTFLTSRFSYDRGTRTFRTELSDLGQGVAPRSLVLQGATNGVQRLFKMTHTARDREGEVLWWEYTAVNGSPLYITIYND